MSRYRFGHVLFQEYIYKRHSPGERRLLHGEVANALERLYAGQQDAMSVQLGHHFYKAENFERAFQYFSVAAERAARIHAYGEARTHYTHSIELINKVAPDASTQASLRRGRGLACKMLGEFECARTDFDRALEIAHSAGEHRIEWAVLIDLGKLWASRDYLQTRELFERALELARRLNDPALLAGSLNSMGNWYANDEKPVKAAAYLQEALKIVEELDDPHELANTLDLPGDCQLIKRQSQRKCCLL